MNNTTFALTKNLIVPATGNPSKGYLLFPAGQFGLSYNTIPKPKLSQISITLTVVDLATQEDVWILGIYNITEDGFPYITNQAAHNAYLQTKADLEQLAITKQNTANALYEQAQEDPNLMETYTIALADLESTQSELANLPVVVLEYEYINKYSDIIDYFNGDGTLTEEGIAWAKQVAFLGEPLSNYID